MPLEDNFSAQKFSQKLLAALDHVEYRRIENQEDFEDVARLRYRAYKTHGVLPNNTARLIDDLDFDRNAHVFGVYYDEDLVSTIRIHHVTPEHRACPAVVCFPETVNPLLDAGMTLIDSARFAIAPEFASELSAMPYLTVRLTPVAAIFFDADRVLQPIRPAHAAFYRRFFYAQMIGGPQRTPFYDFDLVLLASKTRELRAKMMKRFPAFQSEAYERRMLFARPTDFGTAPLTILPTARLAGRPTSPEMSYVS